MNQLPASSEIDECLSSDTCSQICVHANGTLTCECHKGYEMDPNTGECTAIGKNSHNGGEWLDQYDTLLVLLVISHADSVIGSHTPIMSCVVPDLTRFRNWFRTHLSPVSLLMCVCPPPPRGPGCNYFQQFSGPAFCGHVGSGVPTGHCCIFHHSRPCGRACGKPDTLLGQFWSRHHLQVSQGEWQELSTPPIPTPHSGLPVSFCRSRCSQAYPYWFLCMYTLCL